MGFDASFHPISEDEIHEWYFDKLNDAEGARSLAQRCNIDEFYINKYLNTLSAGANTAPQDPFERTHGLYLATTQGFFRKYFYTRGATFTFLIEADPTFRRYTKPWADILRVDIPNPAKSMIVENYNSGVFIPPGHVKNLLADYENISDVKILMDEVFSHGRIDVFLKAARFAAENGLGILEATEVVEPNPMDLNKSRSYSNLFNCDKEGPLLFQQAAMEQINQIKNQEAKPEAKKGLLSKLFGGK